MGNTLLDIEWFQLAVVVSKALLFHELLNVRVGLPARQKKLKSISAVWSLTPRRLFLNTDYSPAGEVHLITSQVDVGIREHGADLPEEQLHEVVRGVQDGVHRSEGARGFGARVTGREQIRLAWEERRSIRCVLSISLNLYLTTKINRRWRNQWS